MDGNAFFCHKVFSQSQVLAGTVAFVLLVTNCTLRLTTGLLTRIKSSNYQLNTTMKIVVANYVLLVTCSLTNCS
jgi:hypothetical protein